MKNKTKYLAKAVKEAVENILDDIDNGVPQNDALNDALGQYETELRFVLRESLKKREDEQPRRDEKHGLYSGNEVITAYKNPPKTKEIG